MPYILDSERKNYSPLIGDAYKHPGQLNFSISKLACYYISDLGESYKTYNDIIGALECAKQELYRKIVSKYEDKKEKESGTIW